jgi:dienelactone hydrolase
VIVGAEIYSITGHVRAVCERLAEMGYSRDDAVRDVRAAIDYLRTTGGDRIGMVGLSVGGHRAYLGAGETRPRSRCHCLTRADGLGL